MIRAKVKKLIKKLKHFFSFRLINSQSLSDETIIKVHSFSCSSVCTIKKMLKTLMQLYFPLLQTSAGMVKLNKVFQKSTENFILMNRFLNSFYCFCCSLMNGLSKVVKYYVNLIHVFCSYFL